MVTGNAQSMVQRMGQVLRRRGFGGTAIMVLDRIVRPLGVSILSFTRLGAIPPVDGTGSARQRFDRIATTNEWGSRESLSGGGSEVGRTAAYRRALVDLIEARRFRSMFDAPCGDFNWMHLVLREVAIDYTGGDISPSIVARNRERFPEVRFIEFDITSDPFPDVDVWHCRDCLFHLSYRDIDLALRNFLESGIAYALITNHCGLIRNVDIATGGWRYINLRRAPFAFPAP